MIILFDAFGELGNRLVLSSILISIAKQEKTFVVNLCFWRYARYFQHTFNENIFYYRIFVFFSWGDKITGEVIAFFLKLLFKNKINYFLFDNLILTRPSELLPRVLGFVLRKSHLILPGFNLQSHGQNRKVLMPKSIEKYSILSTEYIEVHKHHIIERYQPSLSISKEVQNFISSIRCKSKTLVGCHIRRGDYKIYQDGQFYFEDSEYLGFMLHVKKQLNLQDVSFVLASNEEISLKNFSQFPVYKSIGHFMKDLYILASCDYIIGVPSTFSGWASFIGQKPISFMSRSEEDQSLMFSNFNIWKPQFY